MTQSILYRWYVGLVTKDARAVDPTRVYHVADSHLSGYTAYRSLGRWEGIGEDSVVIEYVEPDASNPSVDADKLAYDFAMATHQSAILVTETPVSARLIYASDYSDVNNQSTVNGAHSA